MINNLKKKINKNKQIIMKNKHTSFTVYIFISLSLIGNRNRSIKALHGIR